MPKVPIKKIAKAVIKNKKVNNKLLLDKKTEGTLKLLTGVAGTGAVGAAGLGGYIGYKGIQSINRAMNKPTPNKSNTTTNTPVVNNTKQTETKVKPTVKKMGGMTKSKKK
jgi:hypothetical protein